MTVDGEIYNLSSGSAKISIEEIGLSTSWLALCGGTSPLHSIAPELFSPPFNSVAISDQLPDDNSPESKFAVLRVGGSGIPEVATVLHDSGSGQLRWERPGSTERSPEEESSSCGAS